ncbi:hypothetical protein [Deinococcus roseus]|uniref:hypothetical protein n=1 Tax=Deinococcus roseus TaxID=392414 RepID=UPI00166599D4|nr:hypothetical protein [Deinococcus roseus]
MKGVLEDKKCVFKVGGDFEVCQTFPKKSRTFRKNFKLLQQNLKSVNRKPCPVAAEAASERISAHPADLQQNH